MENIQQKAHFLRHEYARILSALDEAAPRKWGKMNVLQMIEHMSDYIRIANGRTPIASVTPPDQIPRMQIFLFSEKPFRENTPNSLLPDEPSPAKHATKQEAVLELEHEIAHFFTVHENEAGRTTTTPFFGDLDFEQQVHLLHKHATHHLRQFGLDY